MDLIEVPRSLRDKEQTSYLVRGPFAMTHNGITSWGMYLSFREDHYVVYDGSRGWHLDDSYDVRVSGDTITFYSKTWSSKFVIRPLSQNDVSWLALDEPELEIEGLKEVILNEEQSPPNN